LAQSLNLHPLRHIPDRGRGRFVAFLRSFGIDLQQNASVMAKPFGNRADRCPLVEQPSAVRHPEVVQPDREAENSGGAFCELLGRVDAIGRWIRGEFGDQDARPIIATILTDAQLRAWERVQQKFESQGVGRFSQSHRAAPDDARIPGYDKMSFEQRRFAQDTIAARRGRE
jgi:hypothetical protein